MSENIKLSDLVEGANNNNNIVVRALRKWKHFGKDAGLEMVLLDDEVVVLRVSLHCKGCEAKLRKHLSKMEGVSSFCIDLDTKKVTVTGNVTPSDVLTSISRVKNAQFWPSPSTDSSTSSSTSSSSSTMELN